MLSTRRLIVAMFGVCLLTALLEVKKHLRSNVLKYRFILFLFWDFKECFYICYNITKTMLYSSQDLYDNIS